MDEDENGTLSTLVAAFSAGDSEAFAEFYDRTSARVYGMAHRVLRAPAHAEEVTQEVYLQVWRSGGEYQSSRGTALGWLLTLAHRRAVDRVRSEQSDSRRRTTYATQDVGREHDEVVESVTSTLETEAVAGCLNTLTTTQHESVRMAYYDGLTYREVAETLGVALPTIKSRIRDALTKLKVCLGVSTGE